jgi:hypothetical protein
VLNCNALNPADDLKHESHISISDKQSPRGCQGTYVVSCPVHRNSLTPLGLAMSARSQGPTATR